MSDQIPTPPMPNPSGTTRCNPRVRTLEEFESRVQRWRTYRDGLPVAGDWPLPAIATAPMYRRPTAAGQLPVEYEPPGAGAAEQLEALNARGGR
jgi:hypothetical protein